ncbi:hypothetical protein J4E85_000153 [Alternaria conjuncta]|uniref:uncharacterized protein n=1 Tax=Alternaria conjuncta TaxID=181017 RepID=UPI002220A027|nr:uncharacterized protein J4E85_000153 [Alternaria conjuncta]KAI4937718.1 hypothetical protein J4E85_000153 [Alternaria conjuncta]
MCGRAKTLVSDLRLDKPTQPAGCPSLGPRVDNKEVRKTEGSRAFLSVFILCAKSVAVIFENDLMLWSSQIEDACDHLSKNKECEGDVILVAAARLAKIVVSAAEVSRRASDDHNTARHAMMAIDPLILALNNFKSSLPVEILQHWLIIGLTQTAQVAIYDLALLTKPTDELSLSHLAFEPRRIEYFMELLETSKACREHAWNGGVIGLTAPSMLVFSYCIKTLYRFASLKGIPDWIPPIVQSSFDIVQCLERFAEIAEEANTEFKAKTGEDTLFAAAAETLRGMAPNWKLPTSEHDDAMGSTVDGWNDGFGDMGVMDFASDFWMPSVFNL